MKTNYHTHTKRCLHASGTEEDYVRAALEAGVSVLGFSDHAPFPDHDYGYRMAYGELEDYFAAVDRLAEERAAELTIQKGLEIEYLPQYRAYYERLLERVDYLLLGEHFFSDGSGHVVNIVQLTDTEGCLAYARAVAEAIRTGCFRMVAHPDIFMMQPYGWDRNCDAAAELILDAAAETGTILEYNANGLRRGLREFPDGKRYPYPHERFWEKAAGAGVRAIVGSDCHEPGQVWDDYVARAIRSLRALGLAPDSPDLL